MIYRVFTIACLLVFASPLAMAQSGKTVPDLISGTWTGELSPMGSSNPMLLTFQLKFDGKGVVTGTFTGLPNPGDVKTGTFDPKTGTLKLELRKQGETAVRITLAGTVVKGVVTGRFTGEMSGEFRLTRKS